MTYGGSVYGDSPLGSTPAPDEFEEQSEEQKNENYRQIYQEMQELRSEVKKVEMNLKGSVTAHGFGALVVF